MNVAKVYSKTDGKKFLVDSCILEKRMLEAQLKFASESISHDGVMGNVTESYYLNFLKKYLPGRYSADTGIIIDSNGDTSDQIDVVIFDNQYTPTLMDQFNHKYIPAEAVYAAIEIKQSINRANIEYASRKALSVTALKRTSCPIPHAGGEYPAKPHFPIICGIIASDIEWVDGFNSTAFKTAIDEWKNLDFALGMSWGSFDCFNGEVCVIKGESSTMSLTFKLLKKLQSLGTVPAIDWDEYSRIF